MYDYFKQVCCELVELTEMISEEDYSMVRKELQGASVGQHYRHVIEMLECLERGYDLGEINYDKRPRNRAMEEKPELARKIIELLSTQLTKSDKDLVLKYEMNGLEISIQTTFFRELIYNIDHCIHHQAIIKHVVLEALKIKLPSDFGIAYSTKIYKEKCVPSVSA
ncbi:MAG: DinB family protein [Saprospiraceae bacterium]|nr:DinB family protein [Saprospiraceae bacterium]